MIKWLKIILIIIVLEAVFYALAMHYPSEQVVKEKPKDNGIHTKGEAVSFLLGKFSVVELKEFARKFKSGTPQEKEEVKAVLKQRMTEEEFKEIYNVLQGELKKDMKE